MLVATLRRGAANVSHLKRQLITQRRGGFEFPTPSCMPDRTFVLGGCHPEALAVEASRLGLDALGLCDRDGLYGVIRFAEAARSLLASTVVDRTHIAERCR